jgi:hypothetical protein
MVPTVRPLLIVNEVDIAGTGADVVVVVVVGADVVVVVVVGADVVVVVVVGADVVVVVVVGAAVVVVVVVSGPAVVVVVVVTDVSVLYPDAASPVLAVPTPEDSETTTPVSDTKVVTV